MSDNRTIDGNGAAHNGPGLAVGGGEFTTKLVGEQPASAGLNRSNPAVDLSGFPVGTIETEIGFAALHLGDRIATVSGNLTDGVNVTVENPFDGKTLSYIRGGHTDYEVALTEATVSAAIGEHLTASDPDLAYSISSLRYLDDSSAIAVQLKATKTMPERLMIIDLPAGTVTVHASDAIGVRVSDPEWCVEHMAGPSSAYGVAAHLADVIDLEVGQRWTSEEYDNQIQNEFVARVLAPLMTMPEYELGKNTNISRAVANEKSPEIVFSGFRHPWVEDDQHAANAFKDLSARVTELSTTPHADAGFQAGEARGFATALASVRLADQNPTAAQFDAERAIVLEQITSGATSGVPEIKLTVPMIERATALMLKSVQRDIHTRTPDRVEMVSADTVLSALDSLGSVGLFTGGRTPAGAVSRIISGMPLSSARLFDDNTDDLEPFDAPRRKPILGIWK